MIPRAAHLSEDEALALDVVVAAHEVQQAVSAASSGISQVTLENLAVKGVLQSSDGRWFAVVSDDLPKQRR